jgi:SAM-dependent methyltransferase
MKATWEDGDYAAFATYMEPGAVEILNGWQIPAGSKLLDIGCGAGQSAIPAARQGMIVTGVDIAGNLIEYAQERARYEGLSVRFDVGDAEGSGESRQRNGARVQVSRSPAHGQLDAGWLRRHHVQMRCPVHAATGWRTVTCTMGR